MYEDGPGAGDADLRGDKDVEPERRGWYASDMRRGALDESVERGFPQSSIRAPDFDESVDRGLSDMLDLNESVEPLTLSDESFADDRSLSERLSSLSRSLSRSRKSR